MCEEERNEWVLGLDLSTQAAKACLLPLMSHDMYPIFLSVPFKIFDTRYHTTSGVFFDLTGNGSAHSFPIMWCEALDCLFERLKLLHPQELSRVTAISVSAQMHGIVLWSIGANTALRHLKEDNNISVQLSEFLCNPSPIWMDTTGDEAAQELSRKVPDIAMRTGSSATGRFSAAQISMIVEQHGDIYDAIEHIALVSSFVSSLLVQRHTYVDPVDASGTNMFDLKSWGSDGISKWDKKCLLAIDSDLEWKLPNISRTSSDVIGNVGSYWVRRYGFNKDCVCVVGSGDNACAAVGNMLRNEGHGMLSLGTSDTLSYFTEKYIIDGEAGHVFASPREPGLYFPLLCFSNGGITREMICNRYCGGSWDAFDSVLETTPLGNEGYVGIFLPVAEITPPLAARSVPYVFRVEYDEKKKCVKVINEIEFPSTRHEVRACVEGRMYAIRHFSKGRRINRIVLTGGSSKCPAIAQCAADILRCTVYSCKETETAALGAAVRARHGSLRSIDLNVDDLWLHVWNECGVDAPERWNCVAKPNEKNKRESSVLIELMTKAYGVCLNRIMKDLG